MNLPRCYNKLPQTGWLKTKKHLFSHSSGFRKTEIEAFGPHFLCRLGGRAPASLPGSGDCRHPWLCAGFPPASAPVATLPPAPCLSHVSSCFSPVAQVGQGALWLLVFSLEASWQQSWWFRSSDVIGVGRWLWWMGLCFSEAALLYCQMPLSSLRTCRI